MRKKDGSPLDALDSLRTALAEMALPRIWRDIAFRGVLAHALAASALLKLVPAGRELADLDPQAMRLEPTRKVGPELHHAENDVIWSSPSARKKGVGRKRKFFLVEVQSTCERNMALRMMRYMSLHGLQLLSDYEPPLPVIVPVVLYTGDRPWNADLAAGEMFEDVPSRHRLQVPCHLVDLFRLEVAEGSENVVELLAVVMRGESESELLGRRERCTVGSSRWATSPWRAPFSTWSEHSAKRSGLTRTGRTARTWLNWWVRWKSTR